MDLRAVENVLVNDFANATRLLANVSEVDLVDVICSLVERDGCFPKTSSEFVATSNDPFYLSQQVSRIGAGEYVVANCNYRHKQMDGVRGVGTTTPVQHFHNLRQAVICFVRSELPTAELSKDALSNILSSAEDWSNPQRRVFLFRQLPTAIAVLLAADAAAEICSDHYDRWVIQFVRAWIVGSKTDADCHPICPSQRSNAIYALTMAVSYSDRFYVRGTLSSVFDHVARIIAEKWSDNDRTKHNLMVRDVLERQRIRAVQTFAQFEAASGQSAFNYGSLPPLEMGQILARMQAAGYRPAGIAKPRSGIRRGPRWTL